MHRKTILKSLLLALLTVSLILVIAARLSVEPALVEPSPIVVTDAMETSEAAPPSSTSTLREAESNLPKVDITSWELTLVNAEHLLSEDFMPELAEVGNGQYFDSRASDQFNSFVAAAQNEGLVVYITSSYRSYATQQYLFNNKVNQYIYSEGSEEAAIEKAKTIVAYPGSSEHQLGLACDIVDRYYEYMNESLADTELSKWMVKHCAEYGFILRYPEDKMDITGVMYEPWHFRYVGFEAAAYIMGNGLCLEEFIALYE